jgi:apolipoprotein N-acyltransferase
VPQTGEAGHSAADAATSTQAADTSAQPAGSSAQAAASPAQAGAGRRRGLPTPLALVIAVVGGLALEAAFPPTGIWPFAAVAPALLVIALWRRSLRGSFLVGLAFGLAFFVPLLSWLINVAWYAWAALAIAEAVIFGLFAIGQRLMLRLPGWPVAVGCWWVGVEAFRGRWP